MEKTASLGVSSRITYNVAARPSLELGALVTMQSWPSASGIITVIDFDRCFLVVSNAASDSACVPGDGISGVPTADESL